MKLIFFIVVMLGFGELYGTLHNIVDCNFDKESLCQYKTKSSKDAEDFTATASKSERPNNPLTGIRGPALGQGKGYAKAYLRYSKTSTRKPRSKMWVSATFNNDLVKFWYLEGTNGLQLTVSCGKGRRSYTFSTRVHIKVGEQHHWKKGQIHCPKGRGQLKFSCVNYGKLQGACGIDQIKAQQTGRTSSSQHSLYTEKSGCERSRSRKTCNGKRPQKVIRWYLRNGQCTMYHWTYCRGERVNKQNVIRHKKTCECQCLDQC